MTGFKPSHSLVVRKERVEGNSKVDRVQTQTTGYLVSPRAVRPGQLFQNSLGVESCAGDHVLIQRMSSQMEKQCLYVFCPVGIKTAILVGGMSTQKQQRMLNRHPEIVIATPGRLWELVKEKHPHLSNLRQLR